jgi:hypothetical protein
MYFNSSDFLPDTWSAHQKLPWQGCEETLSEALRQSGYKPATPYYISGEVNLTDPAVPPHLHYSEECQTWCEECAKTIEAGAIRQWQAKLKEEDYLDEDVINLVDREPSTLDWWERNALFEDFDGEAPLATESDASTNDCISCSGCGETLKHIHCTYSFQDRLEYFEHHPIEEVYAPDLYDILVMMDYKPGHEKVLGIALTAKAVLDRDGLSSHQTEQENGAEASIAS